MLPIWFNWYQVNKADHGLTLVSVLGAILLSWHLARLHCLLIRPPLGLMICRLHCSWPQHWSIQILQFPSVLYQVATLKFFYSHQLYTRSAASIIAGESSRFHMLCIRPAVQCSDFDRLSFHFVHSLSLSSQWRLNYWNRRLLLSQRFPSSILLLLLQLASLPLLQFHRVYRLKWLLVRTGRTGHPSSPSPTSRRGNRGLLSPSQAQLPRRIPAGMRQSVVVGSPLAESSRHGQVVQTARLLTGSWVPSQGCRAGAAGRAHPPKRMFYPLPSLFFSS